MFRGFLSSFRGYIYIYIYIYIYTFLFYYNNYIVFYCFGHISPPLRATASSATPRRISRRVFLEGSRASNSSKRHIFTKNTDFDEFCRIFVNFTNFDEFYELMNFINFMNFVEF